jgi:hypothetical protein
MRWLRHRRERDDRHLLRPTPLPEIDPIEELARIVGDAQERDAEDEARFERLSRLSPIRERRRRPDADE